MSSTGRSSWILGLAGLALIASHVTSMADEPKADRFEPDARRFFDGIAATYKGLASFDAEGELAFVPTIAGKPLPRTAPMTIRFVRPDRIELVNGPVRIVGDGKSLRSVVEPFRQYSEVKSPGVIGFDTLKGNPARPLDRRDRRFSPHGRRLAPHRGRCREDADDGSLRHEAGGRSPYRG